MGKYMTSLLKVERLGLTGKCRANVGFRKSSFATIMVKTTSCKNQYILNLGGNFSKEQDICIVLKYLPSRRTLIGFN